MAGKHGLKTDGVTPSKIVVCDQCGKSLKHIGQLVTHRLLKHNKNLVLYKCDQCKYEIPSEIKLRNHKISNHLKIKPYQVISLHKTFKKLHMLMKL